MFDFFHTHIYLFKITATLLLTVSLSIIEKAAFHRIFPKLKASPRIWGEALVYALHFPLKLFIWLSGIVVSFAIAEQALMQDEGIFSWILHFHKIGVFLLCIWCFIRFINEFENQYSIVKKGKHDPTTLRGIVQVLKVLVLTISGLGLLQFVGIPLSGVIAFGGIGGVAIGFAAKDLLANFFGGLMIFLDKPFKIGDWIRSPDQEIEGTVEQIGWRLTRIRTFDQRPLFVPNSIFSTISLENPSRMANRRINATLALCYENYPKVEAMLLEVEKILKNHPGIDTSQLCFAKLANFGPYALEVLIYAFTKATERFKFQTVQQEIFLKILSVVHEHECQIAYPIQWPLQKPASDKNSLCSDLSSLKYINPTK